MNCQFKRAFEINPDLVINEWCFRKVIPHHEVEHLEFYRYSNHSTQLISPSRIIGTDHASYYKGNWIDMLNGLKRNSGLTSKQAITQFVEDESFTEKKWVMKYGNTFIITQGNHRLCFSKFLELSHVRVKVDEYVLDVANYSIYERLNKLGIFVEYEKQFKRDWTWKLCINGKSLMFYNRILLEKFIDYFLTLSLTTLSFRLLCELKIYEKNPKFLGSIIPSLSFITNEHEFKKLRYEIMLYKLKLADSL
jgi:hypothetical protein